MGPELLRPALFSHLKTFDEVAVKDMTERAMAEVMDQASDSHIADLAICDFQIWLGMSENQHLLSC